MNEERIVVAVKALCYMAIGALTPLGAALSQWMNSGEWPPRICWVGMIIGAIVGGATQLLSFLSSSYSNYVANKAPALPAPVPQNANALTNPAPLSKTTP